VDSAVVDDGAIVPAPRRVRSFGSWIIPSIVIGVVFVLMAIGAHQFREGSRDSGAIVGDRGERVAEVSPPAAERSPSPRGAVPRKGEPSSTRPKRARARGPSEAELRARWEEPADEEPAVAEAGSPENRQHLPDWARTPIADRIAGHFVVVRRVPDRNDAAAVTSLEKALDQHVGGTVEIADEGPFSVDELRVSGASRLIRARPGFRPIVRIVRPSLETVRQQAAREQVARAQTAFFALDRKSLTLDGLDLILDASQLARGQTALFGCAGSNLTLRNCTITILNTHRAAFTVIRVDPSAQPSRIRLEGTLIRGWFSTGVEISPTWADLAVDRSLLLGPGPLLRLELPESEAMQRLDFVDAVLAGFGPILECRPATPDGRPKPVVIRSFGSAFGRLLRQGVAVASVITSTSPNASAAQQIDWGGDRNLFAGWIGFVAQGADETITVRDLAAVRSTWNGTDGASQEILVPYLQPADLAAAPPTSLVPFLPDRVAILGQVARPRAGLFDKTVAAYLHSIRPEPIGWAFDRPTQQPGGPIQPKLVAPVSQAKADVVIIPPKGGSPAGPAPTEGVPELTMDLADPRWAGDLGAFLRDRLTAEMEHARVRVVGSEKHRFTPVRLPPGLQLEIRVEPAAGAEPPWWSPEPETTGPALIELSGGALVLCQVDLRHDPESRLENLIAVEDAHLVLVRCQLTAPPGATHVAGGLIDFRAATTRPKTLDSLQPLFTVAVDRPVCRLVESTLIAHGTAMRAELGRGLVALSQSAVAAGEAALELVPARVARGRFDVDLLLDQSTIVAERSLVRLGPWPGLPLGPDRPWLVTSQNCAFLALSPRRPRETALLRGDADALARGTLFWQALNDALDVDVFTAAEDGTAATSPSPLRDVQAQWVQFWGPGHMSRIAGPHGPRGRPVVQLLDRPRPGRVEPADLILDRPDVGADLSRQGILPRAARPLGRRP
jgi:serine/threonine-protein kinase